MDVDNSGTITKQEYMQPMADYLGPTCHACAAAYKHAAGIAKHPVKLNASVATIIAEEEELKKNAEDTAKLISICEN